jgi:predicted dehydrogenase
VVPTAVVSNCSKKDPYSITSLARASTVSGRVIPDAFAVFRLITSSYWVGACTGRSAGFSPLGNVARLYARMARDLRDGTRIAPSFEDAVALHRVIAAIEKAAESGSRTVVA